MSIKNHVARVDSKDGQILILSSPIEAVEYQMPNGDIVTSFSLGGEEFMRTGPIEVETKQNADSVTHRLSQKVYSVKEKK